MKKISRLTSSIAIVASFMTPIAVFAAGFNEGPIKAYKDTLTSIINTIIIPGLISIAFVVFIWGIYKYFFWKGDSDTERATGRTLILYGIIGFVIIFCLWGIVQIFSDTLGLNRGNTPTPPTFGSGSVDYGPSSIPAGVVP